MRWKRTFEREEGGLFSVIQDRREAEKEEIENICRLFYLGRDDAEAEEDECGRNELLKRKKRLVWTIQDREKKRTGEELGFGLRTGEELEGRSHRCFDNR